MRIDMSGKNIIVTGGAKGLGRACVQLFTATGGQVAIVDIDFEAAKEVAAECNGAAAYACDLADPDALTVLHRNLMEDFNGAIDVLVNNAGLISYVSEFESVGLDEWEQLMDVNLRGPFLVSKLFGAAMKAKGSGKIVNISSLAARVGGIDVGVHYTTSKAGIIGLTRSFARRLGPFGVNVNAVAPGITPTDAIKPHIAGKEQGYIENIPLRRLATPEDIANAVLFLSSSMSDYITGCVLDVNGGMYMK